MPIHFSSLITANLGNKPRISHTCFTPQAHWPREFFDFPAPGVSWYPCEALWESGAVYHSPSSSCSCQRGVRGSVSQIWSEQCLSCGVKSWGVFIGVNSMDHTWGCPLTSHIPREAGQSSPALINWGSVSQKYLPQNNSQHLLQCLMPIPICSQPRYKIYNH